MSASEFDNGHTRCDYHYPAAAGRPSSFAALLPNGNGVSCGSPAPFHHRVVAVPEFGRASSVGSNVVTHPTPPPHPGQQQHMLFAARRKGTSETHGSRTDESQTRREQNCPIPSPARQNTFFENSPEKGDTHNIKFSLQEEHNTKNNQQVEQEEGTEAETKDISKNNNNTTERKETGSDTKLQEDKTERNSIFEVEERKEFHDSINRDTFVGTLDHQTRLGGNTASNNHIGLPSRETLSNIGVNNSVRDPASSAEANMGYSRTNGQSAWQRPHSGLTGSKMEPGPQHMANDDQNSAQHERKDQQHDEDSTTIRSIDSASLGSPALGPLVGPPVMEPTAGAGAGAGFYSTATTPSTVSTAPSTNDECSMGALDPSVFERLALRREPMEATALYALRENTQPWDHNYPLPSFEAEPVSFNPAILPPSHPSVAANVGSWGNLRPVNTQQRVASFRNDVGLPNNSSFPEQRWQPLPPHQPPHQQPSNQPAHTHHRFENQVAQAAPRNSARGPAYATMQPYNAYHASGQHRPLPANTPPRTVRPSSRAPPATPSPHRSSASAGPASQTTSQNVTPSSTSGNPRSPSEVLKTLLRKKACLYEPDTSRAVALVTWLVGRELALQHGYFSRQQLQAGVHACVAGKIDSGVITRTKVNRCMQIILNSCFHYIIPRPDGSEEKGDAFRVLFAKEVTDDVELLRELPDPWNDLEVNGEVVMEASAADDECKQPKPSQSNTSTPQSSPRVSSVPAEKTSPRSKDDGDSTDNKRAVLLCFNENVRCAYDVFRCHNEFIRDTAHASGLQLSSTEWRSFFGREAAGSQQLWGNIGIPVPRTSNFAQSDVLGMMTHNELAKFRTTWCAKRYDHDHELCGFAHVEVSGGWLRRNFLQYDYGVEVCPDVEYYPTGHFQENRRYVVNACPRGVFCGFAHSQEEILYHPRRYKTKVCASISRHGGCQNGDVCPDFHPVDSYKFPSKKNDGRMNTRQSRQQGSHSSKVLQVSPQGAPVLYCNPAPVSRFEEQFQLPGLKNLYRRHCSVIKAHLRNPASCFCCYSCFGDDDGTEIDPMNLSRSFKKPGLPQPRGV